MQDKFSSSEDDNTINIEDEFIRSESSVRGEVTLSIDISPQNTYDIVL